jgi:hypothetical protein
MKVLCQKTALFVLLLCIGAAGNVWAYRTPLSEEPLPDFPESVYVRRMQYEHLEEPVPRGPRPPTAGEEVLEEPGEERQVKFITERGEPWDDWGNIVPAGTQEANGETAGPGWQDEVLRYIFHFGSTMEFTTPTAGTYIAERAPRSGELSRIIIYLKSARGYAAVLRPHPEEREDSLLDVYLIGSRMQEGVRVPLSLQQIMKSSFAELMRITSGYVDWDFYLHRPDFPGLNRVGDAVSQIKPYLAELQEADDGAMDRNGEWVRIRDGSRQQGEGGMNCSGFAKWVVDGFYYTRTEELLPLSRLKEKHPDARGNRWSENYEDLKDPYFGLDWTRNLARAMLELKWGREVSVEAADVDQLKYHLYKEDVGFPVAELNTILYELAVSHPRSFYLGSVNTLVHEEGQLRRHFHVAVLFPWFDEDGVLQTAVMERTAETGLNAFMEANEGYFIHLVRVEIPGAFSPPGREIDPSLNR